MNTRLLAVGLVLLLGAANLCAQPMKVFVGRGSTVQEGSGTVALGDTNGRIRIVRLEQPTGDGSHLGGTIQQAATTLRGMLEKVTGVTPIFADDLNTYTGTETRIVLGGTTGNPSAEYPELASTDPHGFLIKSVPRTGGGTDILIVSKSAVGIRLGAVFFLYNQCGVRVIGSGSLGEIYQPRNPVEVPDPLYILNPGPDYLMRYWSGPGNLQGRYLMADENAERRFDFNHMAHQIYDPAVYGAPGPNYHPEYYPIVSGTVRIPASGATTNWQPTYSEPAVTQRAIAYALARFAAQPQYESISLTVNDGLGYSEADLALATETDGYTSIGDLFRTYVNTVAAEVPQGKKVAFIAYSMTAHPPAQPLAANVMPFFMLEPKAEIPRWAGKVNDFGLYLRLYGGGYLFPNHWPHAMQDALQYARDEGAIAAHAEFHGTWGPDGPKMWVYANLLWNVDADVDALLDDYYYHAFGPEAAPYMAAYFERAEVIYERRRTSTLYRFAETFPGESQFADVTAQDLQIMETALTAAQGAVVGADRAARIEAVAACFELGRLYWEQYQTLQQLASATVTTSTEAQEVLDLVKQFNAQGAAAHDWFVEEVVPLDGYGIPAGSNAAKADPRIEWNGLAATVAVAFDRITRFKRESGATAEEIADDWLNVAENEPELAAYATTEGVRATHEGPPLANFVTNPSFEVTTTDPTMAAQDWVFDPAGSPVGEAYRDTTVARTGSASLAVKGSGAFYGARQRVALIDACRYRLSFWYRTAAPHHQARYVLHKINGVLPGSAEWRYFERIFTVESTGSPVVLSPLIFSTTPQQYENTAWFDDVRVELLEPAGVTGYFEQDFSSSTSLSSYRGYTSYQMNPLAASVDRFQDINASPGAWHVTGGRLRLTSNTSAPCAGFTRLSPAPEDAPDQMFASFSLAVDLNGGSASGALGYLDFGDFPTVQPYDSTSVDGVSNRLEIRGSGNAFSLAMAGVAYGSFPADGSDVELTWVLNQSPHPLIYDGPDALTHTVQSGRSDLWANGTLLFANAPRPTGLSGERLGGARFHLKASQSIQIFFDDFLFEPGFSSRTLLRQNFESSTSLATYQASSPTSGQVNHIGVQASGGTWSISGTAGSRKLHLVRSGTTASPGNGAGWMRLNPTLPSQPKVMTATFDLAVDTKEVYTFGTVGYLDFGHFTALTAYDSTSLSGIADRLQIRGAGTGFFRFQYGSLILPASGSSSYPADGTPIRMTWVMNHSGETQAYRGLDGQMRELDHQHSDIWVGDTLLFDHAPRQSGLSSDTVGGVRFRTTFPTPLELSFDQFDLQLSLPR